MKKEEVCKQLLYPKKVIPDIKSSNKNTKSFKGLSNEVMLKWLKKLEPAFVPKLESWPLLEWYCEKHKEREKREENTGEEETHLRHQLVHNLRGMEKSDVVEYLMGYQKVETDNVIKIYNEKVKQPFFEALSLFELDYTRDKLDKELQELAESLS
ncbi:MAG: hypothetical protein MGG11_18390 [Trichodesmium sp. MAG_R03]|nr:hypothetical protein [Trichodesmium sp. MAG_R03]